MELKVIIEIEEGSKKIIEKFADALHKLGNTTTISTAAGQVIGKIDKFSSPEGLNHEKEYEEQAAKEGDVWTPQDTRITDKVHKEQEEKKSKKKKATAKEETPTEPVEQPKQEAPKKAEPLPTVEVGYTRSDLARVGRELAMNGKRDEVLKAFTKLHASSLADIKTEDFNALAQIYIELGGKF